MYIAEDQRRSEFGADTALNLRVPDSRTEFYNDVVEELVLKRREAQLGRQLGGRRSVLRERLLFLGMLCFRHLMDRHQAANAIPFSEAVAVARQVFPDLAASSSTIEEAERKLRDLSAHTGLFSEERPGELIRFIHLTFVEYFVALHASRQVVEEMQDGWSLLFGAHRENVVRTRGASATRLREAIPFAVHLAHEKDQPRYLSDVCTRLKDERLAVSCFLETKAYHTAAWREFSGRLPARLRSLLPTLEDGEDAQSFYMFVAVLRDAEAHGYAPSCADAGVDGVLAEVLREGEEQAERAIQLMARYDAVAALRLADLCGVPILQRMPFFIVASAAQPAFLGQIIQRATAGDPDSDAWLRYSAVAACMVPAARAELAVKEAIQGLGDDRTPLKTTSG